MHMRLLYVLIIISAMISSASVYSSELNVETEKSSSVHGVAKIGLLAAGIYLGVKAYRYCHTWWSGERVVRGGNKIVKTESSKSTTLPSVCTKQQQIDSIKSTIARVEEDYNNACVTQYFNFKYLEDDLAKELVQHKKDYKTVQDLLKSIAADIKKQRMHITMNRMRHMNIEMKMAEQHKKVLAGLHKQLAELE